ncbi:protein phosphatase 1 regulatory subunit 21-like [Lineus longissimus]|uniref:protein phosphatase 1 regulatory subunit 21-like n=1 Tax=Lineus longissimus TaxID=88925 RepID=UPI002B4C28B6
MADLQGKYQKLAAEYSKLRSQLPVLKKAVIDEQTKAEELKDGIKQKDQTIRKYEQEIDSLSFRNQQLSKRVVVLQEELDETEAKGKKNKYKNSDPPPTNYPSTSSVIGEELQSKIEENARLHKQVFESDQEHRQAVMDLRDKLDVLEREASQHQRILDTTTQKNKALVDKLQEDKAMLEVRLQTQDKEVKAAKLRAENAEEQLCTIQRDLSGRLQTASKIIRDKLPFNDTLDRDLNALNIPTHDRKHQLHAKELIGQAATHIRELTQGLSNFHTYTEQRSSIYPSDGISEPLSAVNKIYCQILHENASCLRAVDSAFKSFHETLNDDALTTLETATGLQEFAHRFHKYVTYVNKLHPYQLLSLEEECLVSSCTSTLKDKNMELHAALKKFVAALEKVETYVALLAAQSSKSCDHLRANQMRMFSLLSEAAADFHEAVKEVSKHYNSKVSLEHQLPTATQKLKTTDECVVSSLISLVTTTGKLSTFIAGNFEFFGQTAGYRTRGSSISTNESDEGPKSCPAVAGFRQHASSYMQLINRPCPESVPYKVAVQNRRTLLSSTESRDSLAQQVTEFHEKVNKLEQDKEHWMLEAQLLQIKYEKEQKRIADLERQVKLQQARLTGSIEDNLEAGAAEVQAAKTGHGTQHKQAKLVDESLVGRLETVNVTDDEKDTREQLIKSHFTNRVAELSTQLQMSDSKAVNFYAECRALHKRLSIAEKVKSRLQEEVDTANQLNAQLKDELQTTTKSYESHLSLMSEHIASMNDKLAQQGEEIDSLKMQLNAKGPKFKKGK